MAKKPEDSGVKTVTEGGPDLKSLNLEGLTEDLVKLAETLPGAMPFFQQLAKTVLNRFSMRGATGEKTPNDAAVVCCDKALESSLNTVAEILVCRECCRP